MTIKEFASGRGVDQKTVGIYLKRHDMTYDRVNGLTEEQLKVLEEKYPLPKPVEVIEDVETMKELIKVQKELVEAQKALVRGAEKVALAEAQQLRLEDQQERIKQLEQQLADQPKYERSWFGLYRRVE